MSDADFPRQVDQKTFGTAIKQHHKFWIAVSEHKAEIANLFTKSQKENKALKGRFENKNDIRQLFYLKKR